MAAVPNISLAPGTSFVEDTFSGVGGGGSFRVIDAHHIYCVLYFCCYYVSSTLDGYRLDSGSWEPLLKG